jgi:Protein of unknown function, DUF547
MNFAAPIPILLLAAAFLCGTRVGAAAAIPEPENTWQAFLTRYLDTASSGGVNRLRYRAVTPADRKALEEHLRAEQAVKVSALPRPARLAFWINLYNAQTAAVVLEAYATKPVESIRDIDLSGPLKDGPWSAKLMRVEGRKLSLDDIENAILRPGFRDPRIHFALNCASLGCPELGPRAYTAGNADSLMDRAAREFVNSPYGAAFEGKALRLSSLFDWYKGDFGKTEKEVLDFLAGFAEPDLAARLKAHAGKIIYRYDWSLNIAP